MNHYFYIEPWKSIDPNSFEATLGYNALGITMATFRWTQNGTPKSVKVVTGDVVLFNNESSDIIRIRMEGGMIDPLPGPEFGVVTIGVSDLWWLGRINTLCVLVGMAADQEALQEDPTGRLSAMREQTQ